MLRIVFILLLLPFALFAQVTPKDGSALNYRIIGFSFPAKEPAAGYEVEIAQGNYTTDAAFKKNITITATTNDNNQQQQQQQQQRCVGLILAFWQRA